MMERLLNELLMGKYQGRDALKPGFMIIGTQNPVSMGGRRSMSAALSRRTLTVLVKEYSANEMQDIVSSKGINQLEAQLIVDAYVKAQRYAVSKKLSPVPCMRDLVNYVDTLLKARSRKEMIYLNEDNSSSAVLFSSPIRTLHEHSSPKLTH
jgi:MoxR-like ATPase